MAVALGACGAGAKSSDEIGRLAASLLLTPDVIDDGFDLDLFAPQLDRSL